MVAASFWTGGEWENESGFISDWWRLGKWLRVHFGLVVNGQMAAGPSRTGGGWADGRGFISDCWRVGRCLWGHFGLVANG